MRFICARAPLRLHQRGDGRVFEAGRGEPLANRFARRRIARRVRRLGEDAQVRRLALDLPVLLSEAQREFRIAVELQLEARFLAPMHGIAARATRVEARAQSRHRRFGFGTPQCLLREREPQQQRIDARLVLHQRHDVGGTPLVEQPIA